MIKLSQVMESFNQAMMEGAPDPKQKAPVAAGSEDKKSEESKEEESEELEDYKRALLKLFGIEKQGSAAAGAGLRMTGSRPLTIVKRIMKGVAPPPGNAGVRTMNQAPTPKTAVGSKPINVKAPALKQLSGPNVPTPKPAHIKPGGNILPGKNVVS